MTYNKVLLLHPNILSPDEIACPVGLGYISHALLKNGIDTIVYDLRLEPDHDRLMFELANYCPDLVGVTMVSAGMKETFGLLGKIKARFPDTPICVGGPHATLYKEKILDQCHAVDYVFTFEGDESIVEFCRVPQDCSTIKGIAFRNNGVPVYSGDRDLIYNHNTIGFPKYESFNLEAYPDKAIHLISSRGCPYRCMFCQNNYIDKRKWRAKSPELFVDEIEYWYERGHRSFEIYDDNFILDKRRTLEICALIDQRRLTGCHIALDGIRADRLDGELVTALKAIGVHLMCIGVECGNNRMLDYIDKGETIEQIDNAITLATQSGIKVVLFFIIGFPTETIADVYDTFKFALKHPVYKSYFFNPIPYPGTRLNDIVEENDLWIVDKDEVFQPLRTYSNQPLFATPELSTDIRASLMKFAHWLSSKQSAVFGKQYQCILNKWLKLRIWFFYCKLRLKQS